MASRGRGRMAAMVRVLENDSSPEITAEEVNREKLAIESVHRELLNVDEVNLLEEKDMHVFGNQPMTDPLNLVCCNACKKPIIESQYAAHEERCRLVPPPAQETVSEFDGGKGNKKPPRKGRKKSQTTNEHQATTLREQEVFGSLDGHDMVASHSYFAKRNPTPINGVTVSNGSRDSIGNTSYKAAGTHSSEKRTRLGIAEHPLSSEGLETTKNVGISCQRALTNPPAPLATKMYNLHRNYRLRSALSHLYHESLVKEISCDTLYTKLVQGNELLKTEASSPMRLVQESQTDGIPQKDSFNLSAVQKPDQILAQSSDLYLGNAEEGYQSSMNISNKFLDNNFSKSVLSVDTAHIEMMRNRYLPTNYSFSGNSGTSLGTLQQANGSVPVI